MGSNTFGTLFRITTWGESHGKSIGVVIDGCPAGLSLSEKEINEALLKRRPGQISHTSPRKEPDQAEIHSGIFEGKTTGAPISIIIPNRDADSSSYQLIKQLLRPGHANYTYLKKYGIFDHRGGGRASARETACRVAAGAVAKKFLETCDIEVAAYLSQVGDVALSAAFLFEEVKTTAKPETLFCPDEKTSIMMKEAIETAQQKKDSLGGVVECVTNRLPVGLGDPVYEKLEANLAKAMLSMPASKGFEIGCGFAAASMEGSSHNDGFTLNEKGEIDLKTNAAGGTLGGISSGMPLVFRVAFKPPSSIPKGQETVDETGQRRTLKYPEGSRHDPCVAIRAVPVVEAMTALVLADAFLMHRLSKAYTIYR